MTMPAYLLSGQVMHHRLRPVKHKLNYPVFYLRLPLSNLEQFNSVWFGINRWRPMSLFYKDYGPRNGQPLLPWIRTVLKNAGLPDDGEVWLQTFPRIWGYVFNPVSFWYCHNAKGELIAVLAEVNNTFAEHHTYLLTAPASAPITTDCVLNCKKVFHVSPFCKVVGSYQFRFVESATRSLVRIDYNDGEGDLLHTAISGDFQILTNQVLRKALWRQPFLTIGIIAKIHWHALLLWRKKVPFFRNPNRITSTISRGD